MCGCPSASAHEVNRFQHCPVVAAGGCALWECLAACSIWSMCTSRSTGVGAVVVVRGAAFILVSSLLVSCGLRCSLTIISGQDPDRKGHPKKH